MKICQDCKKEIKNHYAKRCRSCYGISRKGAIFSNEHKEKLSVARKRQIMKPWAGFQKGHKYGLRMKGTKLSQKTKNKISRSHTGKKLSIEHRISIANSQLGSKCHFWKGGLTEKNTTIRNSIEFRLWREAVFARDNWVCQKYGIRGGKLHPHHIQNFSQFPELRFAIDNGITLSEKAHIEFHNKYGRVNNTREQLLEFTNYQK